MPDGSYGVTIRDGNAAVCDAALSTMTAVAATRDANTIVIAPSDYACHDGSQAHALSCAALEEQLGNLSLSYASLRDALIEPAGPEWTRG